MSSAESQAVLRRILDWLQSNRWIRIGIGTLLVGAMLYLAGRSIYGLVPRTYTLTITGGDIVNNRHYLAKILQSEAQKKGITLIIRPERGTLQALEKVSAGQLDLAFVQGGLATTFANVDHVATVVPELVHLLVKPEVKGMADLRGRTINLGSKADGVREIGLTLTRFAGYKENVDFIETNHGAEALLALPEEKMPDAILTISSVPSYMVEILVKKHHYQVAEIPFPESLALRHGWAANGQILGYTYDLNPPVPEKNILTVAVNMHLTASSKADPAAIAKLLEVLYSPSVSARMRQKIDDKIITEPSGYPFSPGLTAYLRRNDSMFTLETWNKLQSMFGLIMSFSGMGIVLVKWLRAGPKPVFHDKELQAVLREVAAIERAISAMEASGSLDPQKLGTDRDRLGILRAELLERYPDLNLKDPMIFDRSVSCVAAAHARASELGRRA
ncbi:MAG: hypothetical protein HY898_16205 [Deltaproteobacteria bacterium]|nr:hypothetical protein [Deltaproteobacteria bacterium]